MNRTLNAERFYSDLNSLAFQEAFQEVLKYSDFFETICHSILETQEESLFFMDLDETWKADLHNRAEYKGMKEQ